LLALAALGAIITLGLVGWRAMRHSPTQNKAEPRASEAALDESSLTQVTSSRGLDIFPSLSPDASSIAYSSDQKGSFEIYVKSLAPGGREFQLTSDGGENLEPAWSPDGKLIAARRPDRLRVHRDDGKHLCGAHEVVAGIARPRGLVHFLRPPRTQNHPPKIPSTSFGLSGAAKV
jgi:hypothetical protein